MYLYGDVPYVETIEGQFRIDFTRTPKAEVLGHIIDDLKFAAENLPENPDNVEAGKLTKWPALHLLSEIYLLAGEYAKAEEAAQQVINSGYFQLMTTRFGAQKDLPGDPFSDMFIEYNQNRTSGNKESIWVMQLEYNTTGGGGKYEDWTKRAWVPKYWNETGFTLCDSLGGRGLHRSFRSNGGSTMKAFIRQMIFVIQNIISKDIGIITTRKHRNCWVRKRLLRKVHGQNVPFIRLSRSSSMERPMTVRVMKVTTKTV